MFFFPEVPGELEESVALLDDIHAHPLANFIECQRTRLFCLSQYAFYIFILKLSIHFSRFQEDVVRF